MQGSASSELLGFEQYWVRAMADATSAPSDRPKPVIATLLLERPAAPDYRLLAERIGKPLEFNLDMVSTHKPDFRCCWLRMEIWSWA
jgi:hypothetical protein